MTNASKSDQSVTESNAESARELTPEAQRALAEAAERRRRADMERATRPPETGGQAGPDPIRYGDWEKGGIISDF